MHYNEDENNAELNDLLNGGKITSVLFTADECTIQFDVEKDDKKYRVEISTISGELDVIVSGVVESVEQVFRN